MTYEVYRLRKRYLREVAFANDIVTLASWRRPPNRPPPARALEDAAKPSSPNPSPNPSPSNDGTRSELPTQPSTPRRGSALGERDSRAKRSAQVFCRSLARRHRRSHTSVAHEPRAVEDALPMANVNAHITGTVWKIEV